MKLYLGKSIYGTKYAASRINCGGGFTAYNGVEYVITHVINSPIVIKSPAHKNDMEKTIEIGEAAYRELLKNCAHECIPKSAIDAYIKNRICAHQNELSKIIIPLLSCRSNFIQKYEPATKKNWREK